MDTVLTRLREVAGIGGRLAHSRLLEVPPVLSGLLPDSGIRPGSVVGVSASPAASGATSLVLSIAAQIAKGGSWVAMVNIGDISVDSLGDHGIPLERLALVDVPESLWADAVGVLVESVDLVVMGPVARCTAGVARRLVARAKDRGCVVIALTPGGQLAGLGNHSAREGAARRSRSGRSWWPESQDIELEVTSCAWEGIGDGFGSLGRRKADVVARGRRLAGREGVAGLWLPDAMAGTGLGGPLGEGGSALPSGENGSAFRVGFLAG